MISQPSTPSRATTAEAAGFTLLEILVVLAILGFALALVVGYKPPWSRGFDIRTTAAELAMQMRLARSEAIASNRPVALELDLRGHRYQVGTARPQLLPKRLSLQLLTIAGQRKGADIGSIRFNPDGSSTGGRIMLADGSQRIVVGVDWLTGRVGVADVR